MRASLNKAVIYLKDLPWCLKTICSIANHWINFLSEWISVLDCHRSRLDAHFCCMQSAGLFTNIQGTLPFLNANNSAKLIMIEWSQKNGEMSNCEVFYLMDQWLW